MADGITARFRLTLEEVTEAARWHIRQGAGRGVRVFCWLMAAVCCGLGLLDFWLGNFTESWFEGTAYFLFLLLLIRLRLIWQVRRDFAKSTGRDAEIEYHFDEDGLRMKYSHGTSEFHWSAYNKAVATPKGLLLYPQPRVYHWVPCHAFTGETNFAAVTALARQRIARFREMR
jgi:hypothetical protein